MNQLINSDNLTMSSREIAELTGKDHPHVKRDIAQMILQINYPDLKLKDCPIFDHPELEGHGVSLGNFIHVGNTYDEFHLSKKYTNLLITGYSPLLRLKVLDRIEELEAGQHKLPVTFGEALQLAANQAIEIETQNKLIALQAPAVKFVESYTQAETGSKGFRQVAKLLKVKENVFRKFLVDHKIMYRLAGEWTAYSNHINSGRFEVTTGESNKHVHNTTKFTAKGIEWIAGLWAVELIALGEEK